MNQTAKQRRPERCSARRRPTRLYVPVFAPVALRARAGGWAPMKQAAFLGALADTGSVRAAAQRVGMSRESAYRLRARPGAESFAAAWDAVLGRGDGAASRKVTPGTLAMRIHYGLLKPLFYRGRHVSTALKHDNTALLRQLLQLDRRRLDCAEPDLEPRVSHPVPRQPVPLRRGACGSAISQAQLTSCPRPPKPPI